MRRSQRSTGRSVAGASASLQSRRTDDACHLSRVDALLRDAHLRSVPGREGVASTASRRTLSTCQTALGSPSANPVRREQRRGNRRGRLGYGATSRHQSGSWSVSKQRNVGASTTAPPRPDDWLNRADSNECEAGDPVWTFGGENARGMPVASGCSSPRAGARRVGPGFG
jgi:hypothetical protein